MPDRQLIKLARLLFPALQDGCQIYQFCFQLLRCLVWGLMLPRFIKGITQNTKHSLRNVNYFILTLSPSPRRRSLAVNCVKRTVTRLCINTSATTSQNPFKSEIKYTRYIQKAKKGEKINKINKRLFKNIIRGPPNFTSARIAHPDSHFRTP